MEQEEQVNLTSGKIVLPELQHSQNTTSTPDGWCARMLISMVRAYQATFASFMGGHCRFQPTCSVYSIDALKTHGARRGVWLTIKRLCRCHPLGGFGYDPVPPNKQTSSADLNSHEGTNTP
ncbi:MAG: membrane protein insertion efficiency factor YidD [Phycisphaerales bacterium]|nr:membrane protein insertion efficiency factor YidD [Phycisphaerales bacterium]